MFIEFLHLMCYSHNSIFQYMCFPTFSKVGKFYLSNLFLSIQSLTWFSVFDIMCMLCFCTTYQKKKVIYSVSFEKIQKNQKNFPTFSRQRLEKFSDHRLENFPTLWHVRSENSNLVKRSENMSQGWKKKVGKIKS